ncbi:sigma-E factor negative regulatory protein [Hydrogenophaga laconesensis]|uniref:Sigma-E factor negative regulatory protein RseA n=1 Tax=Hydrogenophaga laconesensis TaxID=1805971 RepID=A0ABU1VBG8_9BURK|nr:sigma-E factor negative regulatory protein [Hydrogenophaga laconesensis]MDR7094818.1 sigma-E factor negative regulatory protein RseA [Hydrogenophaga laconesensis]
MNAAQVSLNAKSQETAAIIASEQCVSSLVDGEIGTAQLADLLSSDEGREELLGSWHAYHVIGDVLRGHSGVISTRAPCDFLADVRERLRLEAAPIVQPMPGVRHPHEPVQPVALVRGTAANDATFRWKLVAGVASLAAVMAVSWTVLSGVPPAAGGTSGPQLAAVPTAPEAAERVAAQVTTPSTAVVVNTGQGTLIRDARLEELLAEHRQNGSMSALQMPTGFIRNATYDAAGR